MGFLGRYGGALVASLAALVFVILVQPLYRQPRPVVSLEMQVALPRFAQVLMAGGDRFLAADLAGFRALWASTENMKPENYRILAIVQSDVSWFNPAHEDNYYIAAAILPWEGELEATQYILKRASAARPNDYLPAFYYAFNLMHFERKPQEGAMWLLEASRHTQVELEKIQLQQMAGNWVARGEDPLFAIRMHHAMANETKNGAFARFLKKRAQRLENQAALDDAVKHFSRRHGRPPAALHELVAKGLIVQIPEDPFGSEYFLGTNSRVEVRNRLAGAGKGK